MAVTLSLSACGGREHAGNTTGRPAAASSGPRGEFLVVLDAQSGALRTEGGHLTLTLKGVGMTAAAFSDRPRREAGTLATARFVDQWKKEYGGDPPNAALGLPGGRPEADTVILALNAPRRHGTTVRFGVKQVTKTSAGLMAFARRADRSVPQRFGAASLFIDAGGLMQLVAYGAQDVYLTGDPR